MHSFSCAQQSLVLVVGLLAAACGGDEPAYRLVAEGEYVDLLQSMDLDGKVCPGGVDEIERQIRELAEEFQVSIPEGYRLDAYIESSQAVVNERCTTVGSVSACFSDRDASRTPFVTSPRYLSGHEIVHAVQRMRDGGWPHVALFEGEAVLYAGLSDNPPSDTACSAHRRSEAEIREALGDRAKLGVYSTYHEIVVRVYQTYGREGFDLLWAASVEDPSTEGLLQAFEDLFGQTLFELMQEPSTTCQDMRPGCVGLERRTLTKSGLTLPAPNTCGAGINGLETAAGAERPGLLEHSFLLEIEEAGDVNISFSGPGAAQVAIAACDGFDGIPTSLDQVVRYAQTNTNFGEMPWPYRFEAGEYRLIVTGLANDEPAEAHLDLVPLE